MKKRIKTSFMPEISPNIINHRPVFKVFLLFVMDQGSKKLDIVLHCVPIFAKNPSKRL